MHWFLAAAVVLAVVQALGPGVAPCSGAEEWKCNGMFGELTSGGRYSEQFPRGVVKLQRVEVDPSMDSRFVWGLALRTSRANKTGSSATLALYSLAGDTFTQLATTPVFPLSKQDGYQHAIVDGPLLVDPSLGTEYYIGVKCSGGCNLAKTVDVPSVRYTMNGQSFDAHQASNYTAGKRYSDSNTCQFFLLASTFATVPTLPTSSVSTAAATQAATVVQCLADSDFPDTPIGQTASLPCSNGLAGSVTRTCSSDSVWQTADHSGCYSYRYVGRVRPGSGVMANSAACALACVSDVLCVAHTFWPTSRWCNLYQENTGVARTRRSVSGLGSPVCAVQHVNSMFDATQPGVELLTRAVFPAGRNEHMCCELCADTASCVAFSHKWKGKCLLFSAADAAATKPTSSGSWSGFLI